MTIRRTLLASLALVFLLSGQTRADEYEASAGMSYIVFKTGHFGVSTAHGRFNDWTATIKGDPAKLAESTIKIEVQAASIDTGIEKRDDHLRNPDFFNAKEFPTITFESTKISPVEGKENTFKVDGKMTLLGVTKEVSTEFVYLGKGSGAKKEDVWGAEATFTIKRTDFGMDYGAPTAIGDKVDLTVSLQIRKK